MDALAELALTALDTAIAGLLPATVPAGLNRDVRLVPIDLRPAGLGGYIGTHSAPLGAIYGRQVQATLEVAIRGGNDDAATGYLNQNVRQLLSQDRAELRRQGIERLRLRAERLEARSARFDLVYEYRHLPTAGEGVIEHLDLGLDLNLTPYRTRAHWDLATSSLVDAAQPLAEFTIADDPDLNANSPASSWSFNPAEARIEQNAATRGGPLTLTQARKAGTQLLWRPGGHPLGATRFIATVEFESTSPNGIGLVFGRVDAGEYCYFLASEANQYHLFGYKQAGNFGFLGTPATGVGFSLDARHRLSVSVYDRTLIATLDGTRTLVIDVETPVAPGEIGFLTHGNNGARFYRARLLDLI